MIANTEPRYCDIALRTHKLVFVATPHNGTDLATWEEILDDMIRAANLQIEGRKSRVLAELAASVSRVASYFHCGLRYHIASLAGHAKPLRRASLVCAPIPYGPVRCRSGY